MLPKWVRVTKKRFNEIQSIVTEAKKNKLKTSADVKKFTLENAESLLKDIGRGKRKVLGVSLKKGTTMILMMWKQY